jgi:hypothetical protein
MSAGGIGQRVLFLVSVCGAVAEDTSRLDILVWLGSSWPQTLGAALTVAEPRRAHCPAIKDADRPPAERAESEVSRLGD